MATTGTYAVSLTIRSAIEEAFERIGVNVDNLSNRHVASARRSIELMLAHWSNLSVLQWTVDLQTYTTVQGAVTFTPPTGTIDILDVTLLRDGYETPMHVMSREGYHMIPDKDIQGRPDRLYVQRAITPVVYFWPAAENSTDVIRYYRIRQIQDTGQLTTNPDIPVRWFDAFCAELASRLAVKFAPDRAGDLLVLSQKVFKEARAEDRERADFEMSVSMGKYRGRR